MSQHCYRNQAPHRVRKMSLPAVMTRVLLVTVLSVRCVNASDRLSNTDDGGIGLDTIIEAWTHRQEKLQSAIFEWKETRVRSHSLLEEGESLAEPDEPTYEVTARLSFDGDRIRHSFRKSIWPQPVSSKEAEFVSVFNGSHSRLYFPPGYASEYPSGHASSQQHSEELSSVYLKPMLWSFRPFEPNVLSGALEKWAILKKHGLSGGKRVILMECAASDIERFQLWLDPEQNYSIVRQLHLSGARIVHKLDITYLQDPTVGAWVPVEWEFALQGNDGRPVLTVAAQLERFEPNPRLPESEFEFEFPTGTWVHDETGQYIIRSDGTHRRLVGNEVNKSYGTLLTENRSWRPIVFTMNVAVLIAIVSWLLARRVVLVQSR